mgnify:CR=1 FL=1
METFRIKAIENNVIYDDIYESIDEAKEAIEEYLEEDLKDSYRQTYAIIGCDGKIVDTFWQVI